MKKEVKDTYTVYTVETVDAIEKDTLITTGKEQDLALILSSTIPFTEALGQLLNEITETINEDGKALVIVHENVAIMDELDDYCICVPTLSEAHDYIYMEQLERNF